MTTVHRIPAVLAIINFLAILGASAAYSDTEVGRAGRLAFSAWNCAALGIIAEIDQDEVSRLFDIGLANSRVFIDAAKAGKLTEEDRSTVPIGLTLNLSGGPSTDFQSGALWARLERTVWDEHWPETPTTDYDRQKALQKNSARQAFQETNCELLK